jgi:hypothetical protein
MKNLQLRSGKQIDQLIARILLILVTIGFFGSSAFSQITTTTPASRCGAGPLVLSATASSGTIKWYDVPFYGTAIGEGISFTTPSLAVTKTYYVDALDGANCSLNSGSARVQVIATISANSTQAIIFYSSNTFCKSVTDEQEVTRTGTSGGTFTSSPAGLTLNASTGAITPSSSSNGDYTIIYTVIPGEGCLENPASTNVTITDASIAPSISYTGTPFCTSAGMASVVQTGATGGIYSATPSGLNINSTNGTITPVSSQSGTYTVRYFVPGLGGCSPMTATTTLVVLQLPAASITYDSPFTKNQINQPVTLTGSGVYTGGTFTYTGVGTLTLNASTGVVDPSTSTAGTYSLTYTLNAVAPCAQVTATASVQILSMPTATIGSNQSVCQNSTAPNITFTGADGAAPYTFTYTINSGSNQTITTTSGNMVVVPQPTSESGAYLYTLVRISDATGSTQLQSGNATITVTALPVATFNYAASPYCSNGINPTPTMLDGGIMGTFSSTSGLQFVSASTGEINITGSTAGTYTVTNRIAAAGGCPIVEPTTSVTITTLPVASFHYESAAYCKSAGTNPDVIFDGGIAGIFTSVPAGVQFVSGNPGRIDLAATTAGTYQIVNTIAAANGCATVSATVNSLVITAVPSSPSISYSGSPYCNSIVSAQPVELTGTTGGTYSALPSGLTIDPSTGSVTPNSSTPGAYTVTYSVGGGGGCSALTTTDDVVINETPSVSNLNAYATCSGTSPNIELTASMPCTFSWTLGTVSDIILDASVSTGSPTHINQVLSNISYTDLGTVAYIVTPVSTANSCIGAPYTITLTVNPNPQITVNNPAAVCSPATVDLTAASLTNGSTSDLSFTYWTDNAATLPLANPNAVATSGTYYIKGTTVSGCSDVSEVMLTVNPLPAAPTAGDVSVTYDGSVHTGTATPPTGSTIVWYTASSGGTVTTAPTGTNTGTYTAWAESMADLMPTQCVSASRTLVTVQINLATTTVTPMVGTYTYTGSPQGPDAATNTGTGTSYTYSYVGVSPAYGPSATKPTNAGSYTVTVTVAADGNYSSSSSSATAFTIGLATPTITPTVGTYTYTGSPQGPDAATNTGTGTSYTYSYVGVSPAYGPSATKPTNAGSYTVTVTVAANGNYSSSSSSATAFTIGLATPTITPTVGTYTYTGLPQGPDAATNTGTGTSYTYSYVGVSPAYGPSATKPTNAGSYTVTVTVAADGNFASGSSSATTFTINPDAPTGSAAQSFCSGSGPV